MRPEDILAFVRKQPFEPFRITLTDGRVYEVTHPELAMVGRSSVVVGVPTTERDQELLIADRMVTASLLHIMQAEAIEQIKKPGDSNGSPPRSA
jgi:hypothetical protein